MVQGPTVDLEADPQLQEVMMELVDQLLAILAGPNPGMATRQLLAAGHSEDEISGAWNFARAAGYTESSGLGQDRLTASGLARGKSITQGE